jgi:hypothetical protein
VAKQRGQVIHPINHSAMARAGTSTNKGARRRYARAFAKMVKRGLVS